MLAKLRTDTFQQNLPNGKVGEKLCRNVSRANTSAVGCEDLRRPIHQYKQHIIGITLGAHAGRTHGHSRCCQSARDRFFAQQPPDVSRRHVTLDEISAHGRSVTSCQFRRDAVFLLQNLKRVVIHVPTDALKPAAIISFTQAPQQPQVGVFVTCNVGAAVCDKAGPAKARLSAVRPNSRRFT